jgi:hypothetical protein
MQTKVLFHPQTAVSLARAVKSKYQALALVGPYGAGKGYAARWLARQMLGLDHPSAHQLKLISAINNSIGIDSIREVRSFLRLRATGSKAVRRVIIIEDAQTMTLEAQNALLKALEEPPEDVCFILTIAGESVLLPTIYSRLHAIRVLPVSLAETTTFFEKDFDPAAIKKAHALSGGYVGLCTALLKDTEHKLNASIAQAKVIIGQSVYERLLEVDSLAKDKESATMLLFALKRVLSAALVQPQVHSSKQRVAKLVSSLKTIYEAEAAVPKNPNWKLMLTNVMLQL